MSQSAQEWFNGPNVRWRWSLAVSLLLGLAVLGLSYSSLGRQLHELNDRVLFLARDAMGFQPELSERLKILVVDDRTVAKLSAATLQPTQWGNLLSAIDRRRPQAILIDQLFSVTNAAPGRDNVLRKEAQRIRSLRSRIVAGAFTADHQIRERESLTLGQEQRGLGFRDRRPPTASDLDSLLPELGMKARAYGPSERWIKAFSGVGNIEYDGSGRAAPLTPVASGAVLPHFGLTFADLLAIDADGVRWGDQSIALDRAGRMLINFIAPKRLHERAISLQSLLLDAESDIALRGIRRGDVVLIVPAYFTGNTDFKGTPYGYAAGAWAHASVINSALTQQWLRPLWGAEYAIVAAALVGGVAATFLSPIWLVGMLSCAGAALVAGPVVGFVFFGMQTPWLFCGMALFLTVALINVERSRIIDKKAQYARLAFEGILSPPRLKQLARRPVRMNLEARERVVTVMFIDVVGFSLSAEDQQPRAAFSSLKLLLQQVSRQVYAHGGVVNKNLGDGLLCYFGYDVEQDLASADHAEQALLCAIRIQQENLGRNLQAKQSDDPMYPLRIGINTAAVFFGDLGSGQRVEMTLVGNGVNFAKRLESACAPHRVMFSAATRDLIGALMLEVEATTKRPIRIKHHADAIDAFEYDPFFAQQDILTQALDAFRDRTQLARGDRRWAVSNPDYFQVRSTEGPAMLTNFSSHGVSLVLPKTVAEGTVVSFSLDTRDGLLREQLRSAGIDALQGEVRWSYKDRERAVHGILYRGLSSEQAERLVGILQNFCLPMHVSRQTSRLFDAS